MAVIILGKSEDPQVVNVQNYTAFLLDLGTVYSDRMSKLSTKDRIGNATETQHMKSFLLTAYYEILEDYMNIADVTDDNFFDEPEIFDILQHFNNIAKSYVDTDDLQPV